MRNNILEVEKSDLQCILLLRDNSPMFYKIPSGSLSIDKVFHNLFQLAYPVKEFAHSTGLDYYKVHRYLAYKKAILKEPYTNRAWLCLGDYTTIKFTFSPIVDFSYQLAEEQMLKNVIGYVNDKKLVDLFPWIDFSNSLIKLLYQPWLNVTECEDNIYFILSGEPFNFLETPLENKDLYYLYPRLLINKKALSLIKKISIQWASKLIRQYRFKKVNGGGRYMYAKIENFMSFNEFVEFIAAQCKFNPLKDYMFFSLFHDARKIENFEPLTKEEINYIERFIVQPIRENLDLKVKLILKIKEDKNGNNSLCSN